MAGFSAPSAGKIIFESIACHIPSSVLVILYEYLPGSGVKKLLENRSQVHTVAGRLLADKQESFLQGKGKKDLMSLLGKY